MATESTAPHVKPGFFRSFVDHPASVNETYAQHARFAFGFSASLFMAAFAALVHALIPPLFETTASRKIKAIHAQIEARHPHGERLDAD
ncbi:DUF6356 family protein [Meridianimarinicoccus aquatilis]|uniref:Capsule biosynthesis protein n=1 Tax=Meridianimarinicoccus aquatilis TaxID=2552766 RepID=A0A4R6ATH8_9RHOB|nr:DUF6356 family protein [Fluviibacterium aquatile]TDL87891.1 hypothetical protein E2L05_10505 [Fluviibacterium aquatile]